MRSLFVVCVLIVCIVHTSNAAPSVVNKLQAVEEEIIVPKKQEPLGNNKCTWGPSYFCRTPARAKECGTEIYCGFKSKPSGSKGEEPRPVEEEIIVPKNREPLGKNKCTWGPSYFCKTPQNAKECGTEAYCGYSSV